MAKRSSPSEPQPARLTPEQIRSGIPKLERRLKEFKEFDVGALTEANHADKVGDIQRRTEDTLTDVFGHNSVEYHRFSIGWIDGTPLSIHRNWSIHERKTYIAKGIATAISTLT